MDSVSWLRSESVSLFARPNPPPSESDRVASLGRSLALANKLAGNIAPARKKTKLAKPNTLDWFIIRSPH
jgi:hypothetical protein